MRAVLHGGYVDKTKLPEDFLAELLRSGRRKGYSKVARAVYRSLKGFTRARERYTQVSAPVTLVYSERDWSRPGRARPGSKLVSGMFNASPCPALATSRRWSAPTTWRGSCLTHLRTDPEVFTANHYQSVGSDMTHTIPHVVNRLVIDTERHSTQSVSATNHWCPPSISPNLSKS